MRIQFISHYDILGSSNERLVTHAPLFPFERFPLYWTLLIKYNWSSNLFRHITAWEPRIIIMMMTLIIIIIIIIITKHYAVPWKPLPVRTIIPVMPPAFESALLGSRYTKEHDVTKVANAVPRLKNIIQPPRYNYLTRRRCGDLKSGVTFLVFLHRQGISGRGDLQWLFEALAVWSIEQAWASIIIRSSFNAPTVEVPFRSDRK